jgi:acyl carrier protein
MPDFLFAEFNDLVGPERRHLTTADAELAAIGIDPADKLTLACAIDEALLAEIPDAELGGWTTVGDVVESVTRRGQH